MRFAREPSFCFFFYSSGFFSLSILFYLQTTTVARPEVAAGTEEGAVALWRQDLRGAWAAQSAIVCDDRARQQQMEQQQQQEAAATSGLATVVV